MAHYLKPNIDVVTCTTHGTNYSWVVPADVKKIEIRPRDGDSGEDCKMALSVAEMTAGDHMLIQTLSSYNVEGSDVKEMIVPGTELFFQFATDDARVIEIMYYTEYNYPRIS